MARKAGAAEQRQRHQCEALTVIESFEFFFFIDASRFSNAGSKAWGIVTFVAASSVNVLGEHSCRVPSLMLDLGTASALEVLNL